MKTQSLTEKQIMAQLMAAVQEKPKQKKQPQKPKRTISGILWGRYLDQIERDGATPIWLGSLKILLFVGVVSYLIYPEKVGHFLIVAMQWREYLVLKILAAAIGINYLEIIARVCYYVALVISKLVTILIRACGKISFKKTQKIYAVDSINGIPHSELINHLLETGTFKRAEIEEKFKIPRRKYESLAKALERLGVIYKDAKNNNAFAFKTEFTRQDLANILDQKTDAAQLDNFAKRIEKTVLLSPTPNFTQKKIT